MKLDIGAEKEIDRICVEFEDALRADQAVHLDEFLGQIPSEYRERLFLELLLLEFAYRDQTPALKSYFSAIPSFTR